MYNCIMVFCNENIHFVTQNQIFFKPFCCSQIPMDFLSFLDFAFHIFF